MIKPIEKVKLAQEILNSVIDMIKTDQWKECEKIPTEMELAIAFNVSRNVVREAIKTLEALGVLESKVAKGTFVPKGAKENVAQYEFWNILRENTDIQNLMEIRIIIEPELAYYAAKRRTEKDLEDMRNFINGIIDENMYETYSQYFEYTYLFHLMIARASKNKLLENFLNTVYNQIKQVEALEFIIEKRIYNNQIGHQKIFEAIEEGNAKKAKKLMFDHIYPVYAFFKE